MDRPFPRETPPDFPDRVATILVPKWFDPIEHLLESGGMNAAGSTLVQLEEVNDLAAGRTVENIARRDVASDNWEAGHRRDRPLVEFVVDKKTIADQLHSLA